MDLSLWGPTGGEAAAKERSDWPSDAAGWPSGQTEFLSAAKKRRAERAASPKA
ncbi:hypothetical protein SGRA_1981 [Saprospira grandis str. Lewin]|uniref:Uncharacterized protein n=1 Tax=Saprospira grandis (strain Lewin) TaxID=984262 RepID=H6L274_SAPGL|nr:hypothetical protein SGRA_1981 [Saprospira grandis str. Lewin]